MSSNAAHAPIGRRIHVIGSSSSGKSTLGARLATALNIPFVDLDALNWLPNWVGLNATDPEKLERRILAATRFDAWVVAGSYTAFCQRTFWPRLDTLIWLDLPRPLLIARALTRSWRRSRSQEQLWGTNVERFWPQLALWRKEDSLLWWIVTQHARKRREMLACVTDPRWRHIRILRLASSADVDSFAAGIKVLAPNATRMPR